MLDLQSYVGGGGGGGGDEMVAGRVMGRAWKAMDGASVCCCVLVWLCFASLFGGALLFEFFFRVVFGVVYKACFFPCTICGGGRCLVDRRVGYYISS